MTTSCTCKGLSHVHPRLACCLYLVLSHTHSSFPSHPSRLYYPISPSIHWSLHSNLALFIFISSYKLLITSTCASCTFSATFSTWRTCASSFQSYLSRSLTTTHDASSTVTKVISVSSISVSCLSQSWFLDMCCTQHWAPMHITGFLNESVMWHLLVYCLLSLFFLLWSMKNYLDVWGASLISFLKKGSRVQTYRTPYSVPEVFALTTLSTTGIWNASGWIKHGTY